MFKRSIFLVITVFVLLSCSDESVSDFDNNLKTAAKTQTISGVISETEFPYLFQSNVNKNKSTGEEVGRLKTPGVWDGPFFVSGTLNKIFTNRKMTIYSSNVPGIPTGVYFCDVYSYSTTVNLPSNSIAQVNIPHPCGYSNFDTQEVGLNYTQSITSNGATLYMNTYTIVIRYNAIGQYIGKVCPVDGNTITFSYSLMTY